MKRSALWAAIGRADFDEHVFDIALGIFDEHVEIAALGKYASIEQLKFGSASTALGIFFDEPPVREFGLRILVEHAHVAVGRGGVEIEIIFFNIFAVIALRAGEAKEAFLQDGVAAIPKGQRETDHLMAVANAANAVFTPAIGAAIGMVEGKIVPGGAIGAVIFADGAPLAVGEIGSPALPVFGAQTGFF